MRVTTVGVRMTSPAVRMSVVVEEEESDNVRSEAQASYDDHYLGVGDFGDVDEALNGFHEDGEAESQEKDTIDEGSEHFGTLPTVRVAWIFCCVAALGQFECVEGDEKRHDVVQHVKRVCHEGERADCIT